MFLLPFRVFFAWSQAFMGISLASTGLMARPLRNPLTAVGEHCAHKHHKITKDSVRVLAREDVWLKEKSERSH